MALKTCEMWSKWHWNCYLKKNSKNRPAAAPRPSLWYVWTKVVCSPRLPTSAILKNFSTLGSSLCSFTNHVTCWSKLRLLIPHSTVSLSHKKSHVSKNVDDVITCDLWFGFPLNKNSGYAYVPHQCFFGNFNHIWLKNYCWLSDLTSACAIALKIAKIFAVQVSAQPKK